MGNRSVFVAIPFLLNSTRTTRKRVQFIRPMANVPANSNEHLLLGIASGTEVGSDESATLDVEQMVERVLADPNVTQHTTRTLCDGVDSIAGYFRCDFAATQERSILHVPLVPPMDGVPTVEAIIVNGDLSARIRITDRQKFGVRLEVIRTTDLAAATNLMVEVIATASFET